MVKWVENTVTLDEIQTELEGKDVRIQKMISKDEFVKTRPVVVEARDFLEALKLKIKDKVVEVLKEGYGWIIRVSSYLGENVTEFKLEKLRERV